MGKLLKGIFGTLFSLILFMGFTFINWGSKDEAAESIGKTGVQLVKDNQLRLFVVIAIIFLFQQIKLRLPKPGSIAGLKRISPGIQALLENAHLSYYKVINGITGGNKTVPSIRTNIMLPTWNRFYLGRYLKIYFHYGGPQKCLYGNEEQDLKWKRGEGTCGYAWETKKPALYDSADSQYKAPEKRLKEKHKKIVSDINSVISFPIWNPEIKRVIGFFNIDSTHNIDKTYFNDEKVVQLTKECSEQLSLIPFHNGVKIK